MPCLCMFLLEPLSLLEQTPWMRKYDAVAVYASACSFSSRAMQQEVLQNNSIRVIGIMCGEDKCKLSLFRYFT